MVDSSEAVKLDSRWTVDGALLLESPDAALIQAVESLPVPRSVWAVNPRLSLQKWCYHHGVPWFILGEGVREELWRWPPTQVLPSLLVLRYQPPFPFSAARTRLKLSPLVQLAANSNIPMILDRQGLPPFLSQELNRWLADLKNFFPLMELYPVPTGKLCYGGLKGSPEWMQSVRTRQGLSYNSAVP